MVDITGLVIRIDGNQAIVDARRLDEILNRLGRTGGRTEGSFDRLRRKTLGLAGAFGGLRGMAAGLGVALTFNELTKTITQFEKFSGALKTATGSAFDANRAFGEIEKFAADTPFALEQSIDAFIKLKNLGLDPSMEALRSYGNTSAALGKDLNQMIEAVADAAVGEFERLKELGIRAKNQGDTIRFTFQGVTTEVGNNAREIEGFLRSIGDVNFAGAMEEQMERLPGLFSNLGDSVSRLFREIGEGGATDLLATGLKQAISLVNSLADNVDVAFATVQANIELWQRSMDNVLLEFGASLDETGPKIAQLGSDFIEFGADAINVLTNIPAYIEGFVKVAKADFDILKAEIIAVFLKIEQGAKLAWENVAFWASTAAESIKSSFLSALRDIAEKLNSFASLLRPFSALPGGAGLKPAIQAAANALENFSGSAENTQSKLAELEAQHRKNIAVIDQNIGAIDALKTETVNAAQAEIEAAREGLSASLEARDRRIVAILRESQSMELLDDRAAAVLKTMEKNTRATKENAGANNDAAGAIKNHARELTDLEKAQSKFDKAIADYPAQQIVRELDAQLEAQDRATEATQRFTEQADPMTEAFENAFRRLDDAASNMWKSFFEGGKSALDNIKSFVTQTLAEIAHALTTKRLVMNVTGAVGIGGSTVAAAGTGGGFGGGFNPASLLGGAPAFGPERISAMGLPTGISDVLASSSFATNPIASGIGGFAGNLGANALLGSDRGMGANIGGTLGAVGGSFLPLPPGVGTAVGAFVGNAIGGLFGSNDFKASLGTAIDRSSPALSGTARDVVRESAFGNVGFGQSKDFASRDAQEFIDSIVQLDNLLATGLLPEQIENVRQSLDGFIGSARKGTGNLDQVKERLTVIFGAIDADVARMTQAFGNLPIEQMIEGFISLNKVSQFLKADPFADFTESLLSGTRTLYQQALVSRRGLIDLARSFDGSLDAANELANATQNRYQLELALLQQIDTVARGISSSFSDTREQIIQATLSQEQLYDRLSTRAEDLARQMQTAIDPQVIGELAAQINQLTGRAFGLLGEEQKQSSQAGFLDFLSGVENLAGQRLDMSRQSIAVDRNAGLSGTVASELSKVIGGFDAQQQRLLTEQERAAVAQREAAEASRRAAEAQERAALARESYHSGMGGR